MIPGTMEFEKLVCRVCHAIEPKTGKQRGDDFKELKFFDLNYPKGIGTRYRFDNSIWLTNNTDNTKFVTKSNVIRRCNNVLKYIDENGRICEISAEDMDLSYRHSVFQGRGDCILSVTMKLADGNAEEIKAKMDEVMQKRKDKQPLEYPSCGSTFKRPKEGFAAAMIEECGLKGYSIGGAQVSSKHSGFVINKGGATLADIRALVEHVKKTVLAHNGVELECEMMIIENQSLFT